MSVHVKLDNPGAVRQDVLGSALNSAEFLRNYENLISFEEDKQFYRQKIISSLKRIRILHSKFANSLPALSEEFNRKPKPIVMKKKFEKEEEPIIETKQELEREIQSIKRKIESLSIRKF